MQRVTYAKSKELSTGLPLPLKIPQDPRITTQVMVAPIKSASMVFSSGKVVIRQRK
jgi:hypothetical protein